MRSNSYGETIKWRITPLLICKVALLSCLIPNRGPILGINSGTLLVACCLGQFLLTRRKVSVPTFYVLYVVSVLVCIIVHFSTRTPYIHFIHLCQVFGIIYVILAGVRGDKRKFDELIDFLVVVFTIYGIFGIIEALFKFNVFDLLTGTEVVYKYANALRFGFARSRGAAGTSINNGMLLCLVEGIVAFQLLGNGRKKRLYLFTYIIIFANCFLTLSRGIWLDLFITQLLIFLSLRGGKKVKTILKSLTAFMAVFVIGILIFPDFINNIMETFDTMINSLITSLSGGSSNDEMGGIGNRLELWGWVMISVQDSLIWGKGFNSHFAYLTPQGAIKESIEVMWLYLLYTNGIVGVIGFIWLQVSSMMYSIKQHLREKITGDRLNFNFFFIVSSIAYFITMFSCAGSEDLVFYYFFIGLLFAYNSIHETATSDNLM